MNRLKDLREDFDLKQREIAKVFNLSQRGYSHYETEDNNIPNELLIKLALFYDTSIDYILGLTNNKKPYERKKEDLRECKKLCVKFTFL